MKNTILSLAASLALLGSCHTEPEAPRASAAQPAGPADALAERVIDKIGGRKAWEDTRCITWLFMGSRRLLWDKATDNVRVESGDAVAFVNLRTRRGRAFERGVELTEQARTLAVDKAYAAFINDSYWMFMPFKLRDPGVHLAHLGRRVTKAGRSAEVLELTFDEVGMTPKNRYLVYVGVESGLVEQWDFYSSREDTEPRLSTPWNAWKPFGQIQLCTDHGDGKDWEIAVLDQPPPGAFEQPTPLARR